MKFRAEQGIWTGGKPPLGYNNNKTDGLIPNEKESEMIPVIFEKYMELASYKKVAHCLNQLGFCPKCYSKIKKDNITFITAQQNTEAGLGVKSAISSSRNKIPSGYFIDSAVARVLKNPVYIGKIKHKGTIYQGKHKPLISEDVFNKAQEIIKQNDRGKSSIKAIGTHNFILEKLLKCGYCGAYMTPKHAQAHGRKYFYYECTKANHGGKEACKLKAIPAPAIESLVLRRVLAIKKDTALLQSILDNNHCSFEAEIDKLESEKALLTLRLTEATNKAQAIVDKLLSIAELSGSKTIHDELNRMEQEKYSLSQRVQEISDKILQLRNRSFNADNIKSMFEHFTNIYSRLNKADKTLLMKVLIKDIIYKEDYLIINYYTNLDISTISIPMNLTSRLPEAGSPRPSLGVMKISIKKLL